MSYNGCFDWDRFYCNTTGCSRTVYPSQAPGLPHFSVGYVMASRCNTTKHGYQSKWMYDKVVCKHKMDSYIHVVG